MIEIVHAENGDKVLRFDGRLLASRFDPRQEAQAWAAQRLHFLDKVRTIFILGMGSGHHVAELLHVSPANQVVIEASPEILAASLQVQEFSHARVTILHVPSGRSLRMMDAVKNAVRESFVVVSHTPSITLFPEVYRQCREQLLGRDWGNLNWQWKLRNGPSFDKAARIHPAGEPLSLHDLEQTELVQNSEERERLLFKALRELVK